MPTESQTTALKAVRLAAKQKGVYQKVFTQGANGYAKAGILTRDFREILSVAGVKLPEGVEISLTAAQMVLAGGVFVTSVVDGARLAQTVGNASNAVAAVAGLLNELGVIDRTLGNFAALGANVAMVIASGGANILADIGAVLALIAVAGDVNRGFFGDADLAKSLALRTLSNSVRGYVNNQISYAASQANQYMAGRLNFFDFVGNVALQSPLAFPGYFPELATYFPSWMTIEFTARGNSYGLFSSKSYTERFTLKQLFIQKKDIQDVLLWEYLFKPINQYFAQSFTVSRAMSIQALSYISMLLSSGAKGPVRMSFDFDILGAMQMLGITPSMLGDDWLFKGMLRNVPNLDQWKATLPYKPITRKWARKPQTGIVINGVPQYTKAQKDEFKEYQDLVVFQQYLQYLDESGEIDALLKIPEAKAILEQWAKIEFDPVFGPDGTVINMQLEPGAVDVSKTDWFISDMKNGKIPMFNPKFYTYIHENYSIDVSDYWKCLNVIKQMSQSSILSERMSDANLKIWTFGTLDDLLEEFNEIYQVVMIKNLNRLARNGVAQSLGIPEDKLGARLSSDDTLTYYRKNG